MKLWHEIVSTAIVGTERQSFKLPAQVFGESAPGLSLPEGDAPEVSLLKTAALISSYRRAGIKSTTDREAAPEIFAADEEPVYISKRSELHLATILAGNYSQVLPEFFELAAKNGRVLPPQFLSEILDLGASKRDLRKFILPVTGERGRWLARHRDEWQWALETEDSDDAWETGQRDERLSLLETLRRHNPSSARELLKAAWPGESAKDRAAFLEVLRIETGKTDEEFLTKILQTDKSGEVRRVAYDLLLKIDDSELVKSLVERAASMFSFKAGGLLSKPKIEIDFPADFEKKDDVLNVPEIYLDQKGLGGKAVKIAKLLQSIPPKIWEEKFSARKEDIIEAAKQSEWQKALLTGFKSGAVNFADAEWLMAVLPDSGQNDYSLICHQIERRWTPAQIEKLIASLLAGKMKSGFSLNFAGLLFYHLKNIWSDDFTARVLNFLQNLRTEKDFAQAEPVTGQIVNAGQFISAAHLPRLAEKTFQALLEKMREQPYKAGLVEEFTAVTEFRKEMHESFQNEE